MRFGQGPLLLKVRSAAQLHWHHRGSYWTCGPSEPTSDPWSQNLPRKDPWMTGAHIEVWEALL